MDKRDEKTLRDNFREEIKKIVDELLEKSGIELFGDLEIEVVNMDTLAFLKGNKIYVDIDAMKYPRHILKYLIAHELAHLVVKRHTKRFWEIVKLIYPEYEKARDELLKRQDCKKYK